MFFLVSDNDSNEQGTDMQTMAVGEEKAMAFPMGRILARYRSDHEVPQESADIHEREVKRYLAICANYPEERFPMAASIDELWHTFLIFTKEYHDFCGMLGVPFIHHDPIGEKTDRTEMQTTYELFLHIYRNKFGEAAPMSIWPARLDGECAGGGDCESNCAQCR